MSELEQTKEDNPNLTYLESLKLDWDIYELFKLESACCPICGRNFFDIQYFKNGKKVGFITTVCLVPNCWEESDWVKKKNFVYYV